MKSIKSSALAACIFAAATQFSTSVAAADKPVLLKMPIYYGSHLPGLGSPAKYITDNAAVLSGGSTNQRGRSGLTLKIHTLS